MLQAGVGEVRASFAEKLKEQTGRIDTGREDMTHFGVWSHGPLCMRRKQAIFFKKAASFPEKGRGLFSSG